MQPQLTLLSADFIELDQDSSFFATEFGVQATENALAAIVSHAANLQTDAITKLSHLDPGKGRNMYHPRQLYTSVRDSL
jgi:hypothetical protein